MSRGLRQGCPIAPLIYTAWVIRLCRKLSSDIHPSWPAKHMSIYADDKHCHWEIASPRSLFRAIAQLRTLLNTLRCLVVPGTQGCTDDYIPLADRMDYLGVQLSYGAFEMHTAQVRTRLTASGSQNARTSQSAAAATYIQRLCTSFSPVWAGLNWHYDAGLAENPLGAGPEANNGAIDVEGLRRGRFRAKDIMIPVHATLKCFNRGHREVLP